MDAIVIDSLTKKYKSVTASGAPLPKGEAWITRLHLLKMVKK